jgi:chorismate-pyruvate lyase
MELTQLEQQKISLTKELEKVQAEIDYYNLDQIKHGNEEFKDMIARRYRIRHKIEELKKKID